MSGGKFSFRILATSIGSPSFLRIARMGSLSLLKWGQSTSICETLIGTGQYSQSGCSSLLKRCFLLNRHVPSLNLANVISSSLEFLLAEGQSFMVGFIGYKCVVRVLGVGKLMVSHQFCHFLWRCFLTLDLNSLYGIGIAGPVLTPLHPLPGVGPRA